MDDLALLMLALRLWEQGHQHTSGGVASDAASPRSPLADLELLVEASEDPDRSPYFWEPAVGSRFHHNCN